MMPEARRAVACVPQHPPVFLPNIRPRWKPNGFASTGAVYYLQRADGSVKIGTTVNFASRRAAITRRHGRLALVAIEPGYCEVEARRHEQFAHLRLDPRAEWFRLGDDLLDHIMRIRAATS